MATNDVVLAELAGDGAGGADAGPPIRERNGPPIRPGKRAPRAVGRAARCAGPS
jgi:hypothetical protein